MNGFSNGYQIKIYLHLVNIYLEQFKNKYLFIKIYYFLSMYIRC